MALKQTRLTFYHVCTWGDDRGKVTRIPLEEVGEALLNGNGEVWVRDPLFPGATPLKRVKIDVVEPSKIETMWVVEKVAAVESLLKDSENPDLSIGDRVKVIGDHRLNGWVGHICGWSWEGNAQVQFNESAPPRYLAPAALERLES